VTAAYFPALRRLGFFKTVGGWGVRREVFGVGSVSFGNVDAPVPSCIILLQSVCLVELDVSFALSLRPHATAFSVLRDTHSFLNFIYMGPCIVNRI
jgi:hypothetical protein